MTGTIISGTITTGVDLTNPSYNPVTITSSASISNGTGVALVAAAGTYWTIASAGRIGGYTVGVSATGSASLVNTGQITASQTGGAPGYSYYPTTKSFIPMSGGALLGGGGISNAASAVIAGYWEGVAMGGGGSVVNAGTILDTNTGTLAGFGVVLTSGGGVSNAATGTIGGNHYGILTFGTNVAVTNQGMLISRVGVGVDLTAGGQINNLAGSITGATYGVIAAGASAFSSVVNQSVIIGKAVAGVGMFSAGTLSNASHGVIYGGRYGVLTVAEATISNFGSIGGGTRSGVYLYGGGVLTNAASAVINGGGYGVRARLASTISNYGSIGGQTLAGVDLLGGGTMSNAGTGVVSGTVYGFEDSGALVTVFNGGTIVGKNAVGALLRAGGTIDNQGSGFIEGGYDGVAATNVAATVANQGSLYGEGFSGVLFLDGGYVTNASGGTITGAYDGVRITNAPGSVDNLGSIGSFLTHGYYAPDPAGVDLGAGGIITNGVSAVIRATWKGVEFGYSTAAVSGTVLNEGYIFAGDTVGDGAAIWIDEPGLIINAAAGTIATPNFGIVAYEQTTLVNYGTINALTAVDFFPDSAQLLVDEPGSRIVGLVTGGNAIGSTIVSTLEFASGASQGTISGLGSQFIDFAQMVVDPGASWAIGASNSISAGITLTDAGTLSLTNGVFTDNGATYIGYGANFAYATVTGAGVVWNGGGPLVVGYLGFGELTILNGATVISSNLEVDALGLMNQSGGADEAATLVVETGGRAGGSGVDTFSTQVFNSGQLFANGTLTLTTPSITLETAGQDGALDIKHDGDLVVNAGSVDATQSVSFDDGTGVLTIGTLGGFAAIIGNFNAGDEIILPGVSIVSSGFDASSHVLTLFGPSHVEVGTLQFGSSVTDGSDISVNGVTPCFVSRTRIATDCGEVAVEDLRVGDLARVMEGGAEPVVWVGRRSIDCARHPEPRKVWPVRVSAHAFGEGRPCRDLWLSPDHALYVDGVLIPVKYLINDRSIVQVPRRRVSYYHVELRRHCVLLAEAMTAESYLDTGDRANFANGGGAIALHADFSSRVREAEGCAPLVVAGAKLEAVRRRVDAIAGMLRRGEFAMNQNRLFA